MKPAANILAQTGLSVISLICDKNDEKPFGFI